MPKQRKKSFVIAETVNRPGKDIYRYYRDNAKDAVSCVEFLYNDWRNEITTPSGRKPPVLSKAHVERMARELAANRATSLSSPTKWDRQFTWTIHKI